MTDIASGPRRELHEDNRVSWNAATRVHNSHLGDQATFFRNGGNKLYPEERALLGDLHGLSVVHLQCNSGQDTLSLVQLGAEAIGVDISDEAIETARRISQNSGVPATFYRADVYDWLAEAAHRDSRYDVMFCSYGAIGWLSDLNTWARGIAAILKPGGHFVVVEFHPAALIFDERLRRTYPYFSYGEPITEEEGIDDYVASSVGDSPPPGWIPGAEPFRNPHRMHSFSWSIAEVVTALMDAGLTLKVLREFPYSNGWRPFEGMQEQPGRRWIEPPSTPNLPLMYALKMEKVG